ncbi:MAG: hypothetical protein AB1635_11720 [Acidobacteriota bacterium]
MAMLFALDGARARATVLLAIVVASAALSAACRSTFARKYEYEEDVYLALDGSATVYVNAAVPALVALRGANLPLDPAARLDRNDVRAFFESPVTRVGSVTLSRREGRRYVHLRIEVDDIRRLGEAPPFAWSEYRFAEREGLLVYEQRLGDAAGRDVGSVGWDGSELVAVRLHLPSRVPFHNSPTGVERGNIIAWEQPLGERLAGRPLAIEVHMETDSILARTLVLFGSMIVLALGTVALLIWLVGRRGRADEARQPV